MKKILFICHGNICRSPMAEFIMKDLAKRRGAELYIESAATSTAELGNPVYPPAREELARHGISCKGKTARQVRRSDYDKFDLLIVMDEWNIINLMRILPSDPERKIHKLMSFAGSDADVSDPWYTRDFGTAYRDILEGCEGLMDRLEKE